MGKKSRKKTTWRKLSLQDDSEVKGGSYERFSTKNSEESGCECASGEGRGRGGGGARFNSINAKKSFLSRKYRHYSSVDFNSGFLSRNAASTGDDASSYSANDENVFVDEGQGVYYHQPPFVYPCFITPTLVLPPYHPSQWYEDPRFPYDQQNYICLTQPLNSTSTAATNSCSSPDTGSDVGYSSSSPPIAPGQSQQPLQNNNNNNSRVSECGETTNEEDSSTSYADAAVPGEDPYSYHNPAFFHPLHPDQPPLLADDQSPNPYFYPGTTYVLKPVAIVRRTPPPETWWDSEYNGGGNVRRRRRRTFIGGEGITYDRWPSRINRDTYREMDECRGEDVRREEEYVGEEFSQNCGTWSDPTIKLDNQVDSVINHNNGQVPGSEFQSNEIETVQNVIETAGGECNNPNAEISGETNSPEEKADEAEKESIPVPSVSPTFAFSVQDPVQYSKYYQISAVDEEEMAGGSLEDDSELRTALEEGSEVLKGSEDVSENLIAFDESSEAKTETEPSSEHRTEVVQSPEIVTKSSPILEPMDEIVVHEVSNGESSECGSEDVEMLGHRYESAADKLYKPNTLSLAAELMDSSEQLFPSCDPHLNQLMERSKRVALTSSTGGYLSNTRHVMESYCSHLAPAGMNNGQGAKGEQWGKGSEVDFDEEVDGGVDAAVLAEESENQINTALSGARQSGISPLVFLRTKGPWHGCCCSIM